MARKEPRAVLPQFSRLAAAWPIPCELSAPRPRKPAADTSSRKLGKTERHQGRIKRKEAVSHRLAPKANVWVGPNGQDLGQRGQIGAKGKWTESGDEGAFASRLWKHPRLDTPEAENQARKVGPAKGTAGVVLPPLPLAWGLCMGQSEHGRLGKRGEGQSQEPSLSSTRGREETCRDQR